MGLYTISKKSAGARGPVKGYSHIIMGPRHGCKKKKKGTGYGLIYMHEIF